MNEIEWLRSVQRRCAGDFRLSARVGNCSCVQKKRDWFMLGIADYLMEEILI